MEYTVPSIVGVRPRAEAATAGVTQYFHINTKRICYTFQVPGGWEHGLQPAMLRRLDGKGLVGALVFSVQELGGGTAEDAIRKAAEHSGEQYKKESRGVAWVLEPYPRVPGAWIWTLPVEITMSGRSGEVTRIAPRWYRAVGDGWIAQFTIGAPLDVDRDAFIAGVLESLSTSREPRCYEAALRELGVVR